MNATQYLAAVRRAETGDDACDTPPDRPIASDDQARAMWRRHQHYSGASCRKRHAAISYLRDAGLLQLDPRSTEA